MKLFNRYILTLLLIGCVRAMAQQTGTAESLINEAVRLTKAGDQAAAISNYEQAVKLDPANPRALYQIGFLLHATGKDQEAIPYLQKLTTATGNYAVNGLNLLGSIYDNSKQTPKAIETYQTAIKMDPKNRELYYNLAIAYYKEQKFADAEANLASALKLDPTNALTHRMYALATFHQGKKAVCILAFCNFLLLDPQSAQALEAYTNIGRIFAGSAAAKIAKPGVYNYDRYIASAEAASRKASTFADRMEVKFKTLFTLIGEAAAKQTAKDFFSSFYADYFYKLAQSDNMPAFSRVVSLPGNKQVNGQWSTEHPQELKKLAEWVAGTLHNF